MGIVQCHTARSWMVEQEQSDFVSIITLPPMYDASGARYIS